MEGKKPNIFSKVMQVFISSSSKEMSAFRKQAEKAVEEVGMIYKNFNDPKGAGFTQAPGGDIFEMNRNAIVSSDAFIGLYGFSRVWSPSSEPTLIATHSEVANNPGKPIMEFEYEWAEEAGLYMFPFLRTGDTRGANGWEQDPRMMQLYSRLRARSVGWLTSPEEFYTEIKKALQGIIPRVFLSYSRSNRNAVIDLQNDLRHQDIHAWRDEANIPGGDEWERVISAAIEELSVMILAVTQESIASEWVKKECEAFIENRKPLIPYIIDEQVKDKLPDYLSAIQFIDGTQPNGFGELVKRLRTVLAFGN